MTGNDYGFEALAARAEITDVIHRYCRAADRRDWTLFEDVFHHDGRVDVAGKTVDWKVFVTQARAVLEPLGPTMHCVTNIGVNLHGDIARCETYITAHHLVVAGEGGSALFPPGVDDDYGALMAGRYLDRFEFRHGKWRIACRTPTFDWRIDSVMQRL